MSALVDDVRIATMDEENDRMLGEHGDSYAKLHPYVAFIHLLMAHSVRHLSDC